MTISREAEAKEIDAKKLRLEINFAKKIQRELDTIANIAGKIYSIRGNIDGNEIAQNSKPDIISILRKIYNKTENAFNRDLRNSFLGKKQAEIVVTAEQNKEIQEKVDIDNMMFINNQSEKQSDLITKTTGNEINKVAVSAGILISNQILKNREKSIELIREISDLDLAIDNSLANVGVLKDKKKRLQDELAKVLKELARLTNNTDAIIGKELTSKLKELNVARSQLIAEQEVGIAESTFRNNEASALNASTITTATGLSIANRMKKQWNAVLDGKTRPAHASADGQTVGLNELFIVDGEFLRYPRDPNGSARNVVRCRCIVNYIIA